MLKEKEQEHGVDLMMKGAQVELFAIHKEKTFPKPFKKGDIISVQIMARGRLKKEWLGVASDRVVSVRSFADGAIGQKVKVKLLRDKHNIFTAVIAS